MDARKELPFVIESTISMDASGIHAEYRYQQPIVGFMNALRRAAYTTFVSMDGAYIAQLSFHAKRLVQGVCKLEPAANVPSVSQVEHTLCHLIDDAFEFHARTGYDLQFVSALTVTADLNTKLRMHISQVKSSSCKLDMVTVECGGKPRDRPRIKNAEWFHQRKPLQHSRSKEAFETILINRDDDGFIHLYEGLVSNLFMITKTLEVITAADDTVLPGSTRHLVLESCRDLGIRTVECAPRLADWRDWAVGFVTNAKIWVVGVRRILVPRCGDGDEGAEGGVLLSCEDRAVELLGAIREGVLSAARKEAYVVGSLQRGRDYCC
ncbi:hypothetical protein BWQ96_07466 [Gracilariopsis chorda]|uniref:Uncharacterized protein n=1 Tax=Gracilariopsis chorda TaxID=448386 RepID=A0A2V3IL45_9FLOR|nr:hypothetical protein BWQ96_07466 [Gracilariopsis chorda]|eukprot:PXF42815.1 hypothetical protein BWQ96_07466 [Gracilariopsis chorda]